MRSVIPAFIMAEECDERKQRMQIIYVRPIPNRGASTAMYRRRKPALGDYGNSGRFRRLLRAAGRSNGTGLVGASEILSVKHNLRCMVSGEIYWMFATS